MTSKKLSINFSSIEPVLCLTVIQKVVRFYTSFFDTAPLARKDMLYSLFGGTDIVHGLLAPLETKPANRLRNVWLES